MSQLRIFYLKNVYETQLRWKANISRVDIRKHVCKNFVGVAPGEIGRSIKTFFSLLSNEFLQGSTVTRVLLYIRTYSLNFKIDFHRELDKSNNTRIERIVGIYFHGRFSNKIFSSRSIRESSTVIHWWANKILFTSVNWCR